MLKLGRLLPVPIRAFIEGILDAFRPMIYFLNNAVAFILEYAIIILEEKGYRLMVCFDGDIITDQIFDDLATAKNAFSKEHKGRASIKGTEPNWSNAYHVGYFWLWRRKKGVIVNLSSTKDCHDD